MQRFWDKVDVGDGGAEDCWVWLASVDGKGYGQFWYEGRLVRAHRFSYQLACGGIGDDRHVCHKCDNPRCVNPSHMFVGSAADNMLDMKNKGRHSHGERMPTAVLTDRSARAIKLLNRLDRSFYGVQFLANLFGVGRTTVHHVLSGSTWAHVRI